eukprot:gene16749-23022_t
MRQLQIPDRSGFPLNRVASWRVIMLSVLAAVLLRKTLLFSNQVSATFDIWIVISLFILVANTCCCAFLAVSCIAGPEDSQADGFVYGFVHLSVFCASVFCEQDLGFSSFVHLINTTLLLIDCGRDLIGRQPMSEIDDAQQWGWSHSEAVLELKLPAAGAVIDLAEQEKMISQWHGCGEDRGSAAVPGIGMQGSKMEYAVKIIDHSERELEAVARETSIGIKIKHPNVVQTLQFFTTVNRGAVALPAQVIWGFVVSGLGAKRQTLPVPERGVNSSRGSKGVGSKRGSRLSNSRWTIGSKSEQPSAFLMDIVGSKCSRASLKAPTATHSTWIIQELCNGGALSVKLREEFTIDCGLEGGMGTLAESITEEVLTSEGNAEPVLRARQMDGRAVLALERLCQIIQGMQFLHSEGICHGDIKAQNVLIHTDEEVPDATPVYKLADFGLSRIQKQSATEESTHIAGTVTHAAPELLKDCRMTAATDVYAFGILMFEIATGLRVHAGKTSPQIILGVVYEGLRPVYPDECGLSEGYCQLSADCWEGNPEDRPSDEALVARIDYLLAVAKGEIEEGEEAEAVPTGELIVVKGEIEEEEEADLIYDVVGDL